jgi:hypothetical protein
VLHRYGHDPQTIDARLTGAGYTRELAEVTGCVAGGQTESHIMPLADTVAVQDVLGEIASSACGWSKGPPSCREHRAGPPGDRVSSSGWRTACLVGCHH